MKALDMAHRLVSEARQHALHPRWVDMYAVDLRPVVDRLEAAQSCFRTVQGELAALASPPIGWQGLRDLVVKWRQHAWDLNEEGRRIQRTIKQSTGAEDRCYARAEVWVKCADELEAALPASPETQP